MKKNIVTLLAFFPLTAFSQSLLLDAACKVSCLVATTEVANEGGISYKSQYKNIYFDFAGLSREQIEKETNTAELNKLCQKVFTETARPGQSDCLYFKH